MRVVLRKETLDDQENWKHLDAILYRIDTGAHEWEVDEPEGIEGSAWLRHGRSHLRELFEKSVRRSAYLRPAGGLHQRRVWVTAQPVRSSDLELAPRQAAGYLQQPLTVLVENAFSDGGFGWAVLRTLGSSELVDLLKEVQDALAFQGCGGLGELPKHLERLRGSAEASGWPVRVVAFFDSDRSTPEGEFSRMVRRAREACTSNNVAYMMLQKRSMEPVAKPRHRAEGRRRARKKRSIFNICEHFFLPGNEASSLRTGFCNWLHRELLSRCVAPRLGGGRSRIAAKGGGAVAHDSGAKRFL